MVLQDMAFAGYCITLFLGFIIVRRGSSKEEPAMAVEEGGF